MGDGRAWSIKDPERFGARFRATYQAMRIGALMTENGGATAGDLAAYSKARPEAAARVRDLGTLGRVTMWSGLAGFVGSTAAIWRWSKTAPLVVAGGLIAPFTFALVAEDVASLGLGTWKFDNHQTIEEYHIWIRDNRRPAASKSDE